MLNVIDFNEIFRYGIETEAVVGLEVDVGFHGAKVSEICESSSKWKMFVYLRQIISVMPQISFFYGIVIFMNFDDHVPPHFHAWYGDYKVTVSIRDGVVTGKMPGRALRMILEWLDIHRDELLENWEKAQNGSPLDKIDPLK